MKNEKGMENMNLNIKIYHKRAVKAAQQSQDLIKKAKDEYDTSLQYHKELLKTGRIGKLGFDESMELAAQRRDEKIEAAVAEIKKIQSDFGAVMDTLGAVDGNMIDDATMKLLNSGLELSAKEWQGLATKHKDNAVMTRVLRQHYDRRPIKKGLPDGFYPVGGGEQKEPKVIFGQLPEDRKKIFDSFCNTLYFSAKRETALPEFPDLENYWNHLAGNSLSKMDQCGDETFDGKEIAELFPVEIQHPRYDIW